jgi:subtilisin-like proprotein convertase family protein
MSKSSRRPGVTVESFEPRVLLAAVSVSDYAIQAAIARASDLSSYTPAQLEAADQWAVVVDQRTTVRKLRQGLGALQVNKSDLIREVMLVNFDAARSVDSIKKALADRTAWPVVGQEIAPRLLPNDPQFSSQWHLRNTGQSGGVSGADANITSVWDQYQGSGVVIAVVDDGVNPTHQDLAPGYQASGSFDFVGNDSNPSGGSHGASVAGVAAGWGNNGIGISGAAPRANHTGLKLSLTSADTDQRIANALSYQNQINDIYTNSWGPFDNGQLVEGPGPLTLAAMISNIQTGRGGLGAIYTWAGGNGGDGDNVNFDGYANSRYTIPVGALTNSGTRSSYSERGASLLVGAYSSGGSLGITTTAGSSNSAYTTSFGGTSSATPLVAGVIALMLEANPNLTWRDVQHILAHSAEKVSPSDSGWSVNGAGHDINDKFGFGGIDAAAAVALAQTWANVAPEVSATSGTLSVNAAIPNNSTAGISRTFDITDPIQLETVEVVMNLSHASRGELQVILTSPSGTQSIMATERSDTGDNFNNWVFTTRRNWDEDARGTWTVRVVDDSGTTTGTFNSWRLNIYGTNIASTPTILGNVFNDINGSGTRDGLEAGRPGATVYLDLDNSGSADAGEPTFVTDSSGNYTIGDLAYGTYTVRVVPPSGFNVSAPASTAHSVTLTESSFVATSRNFGLTSPAVRGIAFNDPNANGVRDDGESVRAGVTVFLDANNNTQLDAGEASAVTNSAGEYALEGLSLGSYTVRAVSPAGNRLSGVASYAVTLNPASQVAVDRNFALSSTVLVNGVVYDDRNANGSLDSGESLLTGQRVYLDLNSNGLFDNIGGTIGSANVPLAVPPGSPSSTTGTTNSTLSVATGGAITGLTVQVNLTHTYMGDLDLFLIHPDGTQVQLFARNGGSGDNLTNTVFSDAAATPISSGSAPFTGTFRPTQPLSTFNGKPANGTWTLRLVDAASGDYGTLNNWSITYGSVEPNVLTAANGTYAFNALASGSYDVRLVSPTAPFVFSDPTSGLHAITAGSGEVFGRDFAIRDGNLPLLLSASYNVDAPECVMVFDKVVSLAPGSLVVTNTTTSEVVDSSMYAVSFDESTKTGKISFNTAMPAGRYRVDITSGVQASGGFALANPSSVAFHVLPGDINRDATVNFDDLLVLAQNYGQSGKVFSQGNVDYSADGSVGFDDLLIVAQNYQTSVVQSQARASEQRRARFSDELLA